MSNENTQWTCRHCSATFSNYGEWLTHKCDYEAAQPVTPVQRESVEIMSNTPRCQVEEDGDMLWA